MSLTRDDEILELIRLALIHSNEKATATLLINANDFRFSTLMGLQYFMNHLIDLCRGCSSCCENTEKIRINMFDVERMAAYLKMPIQKFINEYVKTQKNIGMSLRKTLPCVFLEKGLCKIYPVRPTMCAIYPFLGDLQSDFHGSKTNKIIIPKNCASGLRAYTLAKELGRNLRKRFTPKQMEYIGNLLMRRWAEEVGLR
jgi:Fe-S-cluster containining protein